jgi:hypothetical protein
MPPGSSTESAWNFSPGYSVAAYSRVILPVFAGISG